MTPNSFGDDTVYDFPALVAALNEALPDRSGSHDRAQDSPTTTG
jgi:hypothetical protein